MKKTAVATSSATSSLASALPSNSSEKRVLSSRNKSLPGRNTLPNDVAAGTVTSTSSSTSTKEVLTTTSGTITVTTRTTTSSTTTVTSSSIPKSKPTGSASVPSVPQDVASSTLKKPPASLTSSSSEPSTSPIESRGRSNTNPSPVSKFNNIVAPSSLLVSPGREHPTKSSGVEAAPELKSKLAQQSQKTSEVKLAPPPVSHIPCLPQPPSQSVLNDTEPKSPVIKSPQSNLSNRRGTAPSAIPSVALTLKSTPSAPPATSPTVPKSPKSPKIETSTSSKNKNEISSSSSVQPRKPFLGEITGTSVSSPSIQRQAKSDSIKQSDPLSPKQSSSGRSTSSRSSKPTTPQNRSRPSPKKEPGNPVCESNEGGEESDMSNINRCQVVHSNINNHITKGRPLLIGRKPPTRRRQ